MKALTDKYSPATIEDFVGLARPRAMLSKFARDPYDSAWLLVGPPGTGKTSMAFALARAIDGAIHHMASKECNLDSVTRACANCWQTPMFGRRHVLIVDEANKMSDHAQLAFLSKLDGTATPPHTVFIFTANETDELEARFLSRCRKLKFEPPTVREITEFLARVWAAETTAPAIDFKAIAKDAAGNVRSALMALEGELLMVEEDSSPARKIFAVPARSSSSLTDLQAELQRLAAGAAA